MTLDEGSKLCRSVGSETLVQTVSPTEASHKRLVETSRRGEGRVRARSTLAPIVVPKGRGETMNARASRVEK